MNIENAELLADFAKSHAQAAKPLWKWHDIAPKAVWKSFSDVRRTYPAVDMVKPRRLIFDIKGNSYRLIVRAYFVADTLVIEGVHTHAECDKLHLR